MIFEDGHEVVDMLIAYALDSEIVHAKIKRDGRPGVGSEARDKRSLTVPLCI